MSFNPEDHLHLIVFRDGDEAVLDLSVEVEARETA